MRQSVTQSKAGTSVIGLIRTNKIHCKTTRGNVSAIMTSKMGFHTSNFYYFGIVEHAFLIVLQC